jgi:hypothetical protein
MTTRAREAKAPTLAGSPDRERCHPRRLRIAVTSQAAVAHLVPNGDPASRPPAGTRAIRARGVRT